MEDPFSNASNEGQYRVLQLINKNCLNHMVANSYIQFILKISLQDKEINVKRIGMGSKEMHQAI